MPALNEISGYVYQHADHSPSHSYLLPVVKRELCKHSNTAVNSSLRLFDLGCGNGSIAAALAEQGYDVQGVDASADGIREANIRYPSLLLEQASAYDPLADRYGQFPFVISLEVVEHVYAPREYSKTLFDLLEPGGIAIISTPYHGYLKNVALALSGKMDSHFTALWDHGHIKFWSIKTITTLLIETGFEIIRFVRVGRIPPLAKSMIAVVRRPHEAA